MRTQRTRRDLVQYVAELEDRITRLETSRRLGNASIDSGELVVSGGDVVVKDSTGKTVLTIKHGSSPQIWMTPTSSSLDDYLLAFLGWESSTQGAALQLDVNRIEDDGSYTRNGGKLLLMRDAAYLSHQPADGSPEAFFGAGVGGNGLLYAKGKWYTNNNIGDGDAAIICSSVVVGAGVSTFSHTYATPSNGTMIPVVQMLNSAGALGGCLTAQSNSGFTFAWTGTLAKVINFWAFRM
jgi:hypothetical protein